jgi:transcriptional antiterminator RfaH
VKGWYIARSQPRKETWLSTSLTSFGVEVFYPRILARKRGKYVNEPLFPAYLFCRLDPDSADWPAIRWAHGLSYFLSADGQPSRIPDDLVEYIRRRAETWNAGEFSARNLQPGARVTIAHGPFAGLDGIFQRYIPSRQRCQILLQVVGRLTVLELPEIDLAVTLARL